MGEKNIHGNPVEGGSGAGSNGAEPSVTPKTGVTVHIHDLWWTPELTVAVPYPEAYIGLGHGRERDAFDEGAAMAVSALLNALEVKSSNPTTPKGMND